MEGTKSAIKTGTLSERGQGGLDLQGEFGSVEANRGIWACLGGNVSMVAGADFWFRLSRNGKPTQSGEPDQS